MLNIEKNRRKKKMKPTIEQGQSVRGVVRDLPTKERGPYNPSVEREDYATASIAEKMKDAGRMLVGNCIGIVNENLRILDETLFGRERYVPYYPSDRPGYSFPRDTISRANNSSLLS
jgi:hypothetical protein